MNFQSIEFLKKKSIVFQVENGTGNVIHPGNVTYFCDVQEQLCPEVVWLVQLITIQLIFPFTMQKWWMTSTELSQDA